MAERSASLQAESRAREVDERAERDREAEVAPLAASAGLLASLPDLPVKPEGAQRSIARHAMSLQAARGNQYVKSLLHRTERGTAGDAGSEQRSSTVAREAASAAPGRVASERPAPGVLQRDGGGTTVTMNLGAVQRGTYNVTGSDFAAAVTQMNARGEWGLGGIRNINMSSGSVGEDGIVSSVTITGQYFTSLPNWTQLASKPERVQQEWNRMLTALRGHENHHVSIAQEHMNALPDALSNIHEDDLQRVWGEKMDALGQAQRDYDGETTNGQTEGVTLDSAVEDEPEEDSD